MNYKEKVYRYFIVKNGSSNYEVKFAICISKTAAEAKSRELHADHFDVICTDDKYVQEWKETKNAERYYHWSDSFCYMH